MAQLSFRSDVSRIVHDRVMGHYDELYFLAGNWGLDIVYIYIVSRPLHIRGIWIVSTLT